MSSVTLQLEDGIALITLDNQKKLNALTPSMMQNLEDLLIRLAGEKEVFCVLLCAAGEKFFCAGADVNAWSDLSSDEFANRWVRAGHRLFDRLARLNKPTIAVLHGSAFGGGLELAAACDIRIMAPHAEMALPETSIGIVPGWSGTQRLARLIPESVLKEMALFGRRITAQRAHDHGFVADVSENPLNAAKSIALQLKAHSPLATRLAKNMIHAGAGEDRAAIIETLASGFAAASHDKQEGVTAFREKRKPKFSGN